MVERKTVAAQDAQLRVFAKARAGPSAGERLTSNVQI